MLSTPSPAAATARSTLRASTFRPSCPPPLTVYPPDRTSMLSLSIPSAIFSLNKIITPGQLSVPHPFQPFVPTDRRPEAILVAPTPNHCSFARRRRRSTRLAYNSRVLAPLSEEAFFLGERQLFRTVVTRPFTRYYYFKMPAKRDAIKPGENYSNAITRASMYYDLYHVISIIVGGIFTRE